MGDRVVAVPGCEVCAPSWFASLGIRMSVRMQGFSAEYYAVVRWVCAQWVSIRDICKNVACVKMILSKHNREVPAFSPSYVTKNLFSPPALSNSTATNALAAIALSEVYFLH